VRFKVFLESDDSQFDFGPAKSAEEAAQLIFADCQPFLKESHFISSPRFRLYRGLNHLPDRAIFAEVKSMLDRGPRDSSAAIHKLLDAHFKEKFGIPFRSQGVFTTSKMGIASDYGAVKLIFPIGKFDYLWSPKIEDAYNAFDGWKYGDDPHVLKDFPQHFSMKHIWAMEDEREDWTKYKKELADALEEDDFGYVLNSGLTEAMERGNEIMLKCPAYYAVYNEIPASVTMANQREANKLLQALEDLIRHRPVNKDAN